MKRALGAKWVGLVTVLAVINGAGWFWATRRMAPTPTPLPTLAVTLATPDDPGLTQRVAIRFAEAMVDDGQLGQALPEGAIALEPKIAARFVWEDATTAVLAPEEPLPLATPFTLTVTPSLRSLAGARLAQPVVHHFESARPRLKEVRQVALLAGPAARLLLRFNQPVEPDLLRRLTTLADANGQPVAFEVASTEAGGELVVTTSPMAGTELTLKLDAGLTGTEGPLPVGKETIESVQLTSTLRLSSFGAYCTDDAQRISFYANQILDEETLPAFVRIEPEVPFTVSRSWHSYYLDGDFVCGERYRIIVEEGLSAGNGASLLSPVTQWVTIPHREPAVRIDSPGSLLTASGQGLVALRSVNIDKLAVEIVPVFANNVVHLMRDGGERYWRGSVAHDLGRQPVTRELTIATVEDEWQTTYLDVGEMVGPEARGFFMVTVADKQRSWRSDSRLVNRSDLALSAKRAGDELLVWVTRLTDAVPQPGALVTVYTRASQELWRARTDDDGIVRFPLPEATDQDRQPFAIVAALGGDLAALAYGATPVSTGSFATAGREYRRDGYEGFLFTDRGIYRPGETVHLQALVRSAALALPGEFPVEFRLRRPDGRRLTTVTAPVNAAGSALADVPLTTEAMTGPVRVSLATPGGEPFATHTFLVEDYLPDRIKVTVTDWEERRYRAGEEVACTVSGRYLFGQPAAGLVATIAPLYLSESFHHPAWAGYRFEDSQRPALEAPGTPVEAKLDEEGQAVLRFTLPAKMRPPAAVRIAARISVREQGGRAVTIGAERRFDPYPAYVGLKREATGFGISGRKERIAVALVMPDGSGVARGIVKIAFVQVKRHGQYELLNGYWQYREACRETTVKEETCLVTGGRGTVELVPPGPGDFRVVATVEESGAAADLRLTCRGEGAPEPSVVELSRVGLTLDRQGYAPGEEAVLLVKAPFAGTGLLTIESDRIERVQRVTLTGEPQEIRLPVVAGYWPNAYCVLSAVRGTSLETSGLPHRALGIVPLELDNEVHRLGVRIEAPAAVRSGKPFTVRVKVTDRAGQGVPADVTLAAVDEGICQLTAYRTPDPWAAFYARRALGVETLDLFDELMPELDAPRLGRESHAGGDGIRARMLNPVAVKRVESIAIWRPAIATDDEGVATVELTVPESFNGELRVMAVVAANGGDFGASHQPVSVRQPVMIETSLPRFLAPGDACRVPLTIFNQTGADGTATVNVDGQRLELPVVAGRQASAWVDLAPAKLPGKRAVIAEVELNGEQSRQTVDLPVRPPSSLTRLSGWQRFEAGTTSAVNLPAGWLAGTEQYRLAFSPLPTVELGESLDYLLEYPYGCLEQTTSKVFPLVVFDDLAGDLRPGLVGQPAREYILAGIDRIASMQLADGSFAMWPGGKTPADWAGTYATHFLVEAKNAGYPVPGSLLDDALDALTARLAGNAELSNPERAFMAYVLTLGGKAPKPWLFRLAEEGAKLPLYSRMHLAEALALIGEHRRCQTLLDLAATPAEGPLRDPNTYHSPVRETAMVLSTLLALRPQDARIPALVERLRMSRLNLRWGTTQDNVYALLAMGKYMRVQRQQPTDYVVTVRRGDQVLCQFSHSQPTVLTPTLAADAATVSVEIAGKGDLYLYWQAEGVPANGRQTEVDAELRVRRRYLDLAGEPLAEPPRSGQLVMVELTVANRESLRDVVIADLLPAGLEIENPNLATRQGAPSTVRSTLFPAHVERRDDRLLIFVDLPGIGEHRYYYLARAVTVGDFALPPVAASCMYRPEVMSVHGAGRLEVRP